MGCSQETQKFASKDTVSILALGDSYTIGESVSESERWPVQLESGLNGQGVVVKELKIIAKTGWRTDELRKAVHQSNVTSKYDLVTLLIGVNNQYQGKDKMVYQEEFEKCLKQAIDQVKEDGDVVVVSIPDYAYTPFGQTKNGKKISEEINFYNGINKKVSKKYKVRYVDITDITRKGLERPTYVAADGLHPSGDCYAEFVPRILKVLGY